MVKTAFWKVRVSLGESVVPEVDTHHVVPETVHGDHHVLGSNHVLQQRIFDSDRETLRGFPGRTMRQRKFSVSGCHVVDEIVEDFADVFGFLSSSIQVLMKEISFGYARRSYGS